MTGGLIALAAALLVATVLGVALRRRAGRFRPRPALGSVIPGPASTGTASSGVQSDSRT
jgi:hypothetical protein